ncbi:MAG: hypothetical protein JWN62_699, partial [Acidimicrobiales bacterium]|nr:hypothetical protein [Acidimicrobiales bacterium]
FRVTDGARTRDPQYHKLMLYQLSYDHQERTVCHVIAPFAPSIVADGEHGRRGRERF